MMRKTLFIPALAPVFLLAVVITSANYTFACHCEDKDLDDAGCLPATGWTTAEEADAAAYGIPSLEESNLSNLLLAILPPIGAVVLLRKAFRKR